MMLTKTLLPKKFNHARAVAGYSWQWGPQLGQKPAEGGLGGWSKQNPKWKCFCSPSETGVWLQLLNKHVFNPFSGLVLYLVQGWVFCSALLWLLCLTSNLKSIVIYCHAWPSQVSERGQNAEMVRPFSLASTARDIEWEEEIYEVPKPEVGDQAFIFFMNFINLTISYFLGSRVAAGCWEIFAKKQVLAKWGWWWGGTWEDQGSPPAKGRLVEIDLQPKNHLYF